MTRIAINGLGRIGRAVLKVLLDQGEDVVAVNDLIGVEDLAYLLQFDSVYGRWLRPVKAAGRTLVAGCQTIDVLNESTPSRLPWGEMRVDLVLECTGAFPRAEDMRGHLDAGARHVLLSAPAKGKGIPTVVYPVNSLPANLSLLSVGSCTTNCVAPVMEILSRRIGVERALMTTVHAYTSSQRLVDGPSKDPRRGRAAAVSIIPTSTGAARTVTQVVDGLDGRFTGTALRVPVPVGSIADVIACTSRDVTAADVNEVLREEAASIRYEGVVAVSDDPLVSADIIGDTHAATADLTSTQVSGGRLLLVRALYDNEYGFVHQMTRVVRSLSDAVA